MHGDRKDLLQAQDCERLTYQGCAGFRCVAVSPMACREPPADLHGIARQVRFELHSGQPREADRLAAMLQNRDQKIEAGFGRDFPDHGEDGVGIFAAAAEGKELKNGGIGTQLVE